MLEASAHQTVGCDDPGNLVVHVASRPDSGTGKPDWFGAVITKKNYVSYHLMPLYDDPSIGDGMSEGLSKRRQGKSCFNFKLIDPVLFDELAKLTRKANETPASRGDRVLNTIASDPAHRRSSPA